MKISILLVVLAGAVFAEDSSRLVRVDHYVPVRSMAPQIAGQTAEIYVREVVKAGIGLRAPASADPVVLFVHGAGTPAEVAFDVPYQDYSWMQFLAQAGYDVFSMDMTGYGRSTRPAAMNDPCNLSQEQQKTFVPALAAAPCQPSYAHQMTTLPSDWNDIDAVVRHIRALRHAGPLNLVAWSLGGPRAGGYAAQHPENVRKLVLPAPAYNRNAKAEAPAQVPANGAAFTTQSQDEFVGNWDRQKGCPAQYEQATSDAVWSSMIESDPVGATWGTGVAPGAGGDKLGSDLRRGRQTQIPTLMVSGAHDKQVPPDRVRDLYADLGAKNKVFVDLACSSHNPMWETNHLLLFRASLEWISQGTVNGSEQGMLRIGY